jgi:LacI family transcriptional regulator
MLVRRRVDGILLASAQASLVESRLARRRPPIVCFDRDPPGLKAGVVVIDNALASSEATRHLIDLGHQRIAVIAGPETTLTGRERLEGARKALLQAHIPLPQEYVRHGDFSVEGGYRAALEILQLPTPSTAVLACNNRMTFGLIRALKDLGLKCPQDVSVIGFDEFDWYELLSPHLTTVVQPCCEMGKLATQVMIQVIMAQDQYLEGDKENRVVLKAHLRLRESTAPPPTVVSMAVTKASPAISPAAKSSSSDVVLAGTEKVAV